ncbi:MAG: PfkB family carbohydrate kinase, partial [Clostridia bacterium]|nr:PfkB family carbohydrate kinase [Clostridia bacterium]
MSEKNFKIFGGLEAARLDDLLVKAGRVRAAVIGDLCLDVYWYADMTKSELSRETPHFPLPVVGERMSPGAGGNVAANIAALSVQSTLALGVVGRDWRGSSLIEQLSARGIDTGGIVVSSGRTTNAYCKPLRKGISSLEYEDPRIDFDNFTPLLRADEQELIAALDAAAQGADVLCVADQMRFGCITRAVRERILSLAAQGLTVVVDSRDRIGLFGGCILKPNSVEGARAAGIACAPAESDIETQSGIALALADASRSQVCMTLGAYGCVCAQRGEGIYVPAREVAPPI